MMSDDQTRMITFRRNLIRVSVTFVVTFAFVWKGNADTTKTLNNGNEPAKPTCATFATKRAIGAIRRAVKCPKGKGRGVESGECFACGQVGHIARHCPKSSQK